ncbi:unnamed protein product, partial [Brachionus calyciflorus]
IEEMKKKMYEEIKAQMEINQQIIQDTNTSFKERLQKAQQETATETKENKLKEELKNKVPYLTNLNEDPILSYVICHFLDAEETKIGRSDNSKIKLSGLSILTEHATIKNKKGKITLNLNQMGAKVKVNGINVEDSIELKHNDRILFGSSNMYVFINPVKSDPKEKRITWENAQKEIAEAKGYSSQNTSLTKEQKEIQEEIIELLPIIGDVNAISDELNKHRLFEIIIVPSIAFEEHSSKTAHNQKVMVKMTNLQNMNVWLWDKGKLMNRKYLMQDLYQHYLEGEDTLLKIKKEEDPFWEPPEDLFIGLTNFFLHSLVYCMDFEDKAYICDYRGQEIGTMMVTISPCASDGKALGEKAYTEDPNTLLNKQFNFSIHISKCEINHFENAKGFKIKFKVFGSEDFIETPMIANANELNFNFKRIINYKALSSEHLSFFETSCISFLIYAIQKDAIPKGRVVGLSTRELKILREHESKENTYKEDFKMKQSHDIDPTQIKLELSLLQRKYEILEEKEIQLNKLCNNYLKKNIGKESQALLNEIIKILNSKPKK